MPDANLGLSFARLPIERIHTALAKQSLGAALVEVELHRLVERACRNEAC